MNVALRLNETVASDEELDELTRIIFLIADGWHDWLEPDPADSRLNQYFMRNPHHRELLEKSFAATQAYGERQRAIVFVTFGDREESDSRTFPLAVARRYLQQPLRLLVENFLADGTFFAAIIAPLDSELARLLRTPAGPVVIAQGGGKSEVIKVLRASLERNPERGYPERLVVLADSDARYPGHMDSASNDLTGICQQSQIPLVLLRKRAIENYLPDRVLDQYAAFAPDVRGAVDFVKGLAPPQRDHYPLKSGLTADLSDGERELYDDVAIPVRNGTAVEAPRTPSLRRLMDYCLGQGLSFTESDLDERVCRSEIEDVIATIRREL